MTTRARAARLPRAAVAEAPGRHWEIDLLRTVAVAMMVGYHAGFDLHLLAPSLGLDPFAPAWQALQVATGTTFVGVAGLSFSVSSARARARGLSGRGLWRKHALRGAELMGWGLVVTLATLIALGPDRYIRWGVLSVIGACVALGPLVARLGRWNALLGAAVILASLPLKGLRADVPGLLLLGVKPHGGAGIDWYPLSPWAGVFLVGMAVGALLYPDGSRGRRLARLPQAPPRGAVRAPGRHTLAIYLLHQPLLLALLAGLLTLAGVGLD